jgi:hypothetical protein
MLVQAASRPVIEEDFEMMSTVGRVVALVAMVSLGYALAATRTAWAWTYDEKMAAQGECRDLYPDQNLRPFHACAIGVTLYGDGRQWEELGWEDTQSYNSCRVVCNGTGEYEEICREGCRIARNID